MKHMLEMIDYSVGVVMMVVFAVIVFGIMNTLFMALYERTFEFGVLRAIGTRNGALRGLIVREAAALAVFASAIGIVLGALLIYIGSIYGMNLTGVEFAGTTFTEGIHTVFRIRQFLFYPIIIILFTMLVSFYPARHATRTSVSRALQRSF